MLKHAKTIKKIFLEMRAFIPLPFFTLRGLAIIFSVSTAFAGGISSGEVISLANESRAVAGLSVLSENKDLTKAATEKAYDMINNDYFAHTSPTGVDPWHWFENVGYNYKYAGENLAVNYTNAKDQDTAWMNSPTHRANILNPQYQEIGVAVVEGKIGGKETLVTVELFGTPFVAVADQIAPQPSRGESVLVGAGTPLVKGIETDAWVNTGTNSLLGKTIAVLFMKMSWQDFSALFSVVVLALSILIAPFSFVVRAYGTLAIILKAKKAENVTVMA